MRTTNVWHVFPFTRADPGDDVSAAVLASYAVRSSDSCVYKRVFEFPSDFAKANAFFPAGD